MAGSIKEAIGKITGDPRIEAEGAAEKTAGTIEANAADAAEKARRALGR